jgi:hypothetical protein
MPTTDDSRPAVVMVRRQCGSVSMRPTSGSTRSGSWYSHPGLVLLRAAVMVDGEQSRSRGLGRRAQVDGRLPAPGPDLHEGRGRSRREVGLAGSQGSGEQRLPFVVGHEAPGAARRDEEGLHPRRVEGRRSRATPRSSGRGCAGRPQRFDQSGPLAGTKGHVDPEPLDRLGHPAGPRRQRVVGEERDGSLGELGVAAQGGIASTMRGGAFFGKRSSMASHVSVSGSTRPDCPRGWPAASRSRRTRSGCAPRSWPGRRCGGTGPHRGTRPARPESASLLAASRRSGSAPAARRSRPAAAAGTRRPAWPTRCRAGSAPGAAADGRGVEAPGRLGPDLGVGADVPRRLMASARNVGVRSLSPGMASKPRVRYCGPDERPHRLVERPPVGHARCAGQEQRGGRRGTTAAGSGSRPSLEARTRNSSSVEWPARVVAQVSATRLARSSGVSSERCSARARPVRGLVADPEDAPPAGVDHGEALGPASAIPGWCIEDEVARRRAGPSVDGRARTATGTTPRRADGRLGRRRAPGRRKGLLAPACRRAGRPAGARPAG